MNQLLAEGRLCLQVVAQSSKILRTCHGPVTIVLEEHCDPRLILVVVFHPTSTPLRVTTSLVVVGNQDHLFNLDVFLPLLNLGIFAKIFYQRYEVLIDPILEENILVII